MVSTGLHLNPADVCKSPKMLPYVTRQRIFSWSLVGHYIKSKNVLPPLQCDDRHPSTAMQSVTDSILFSMTCMLPLRQ